MRFVDLFCGIGGFHSALAQLGHECVFACDADKDAAAMYEENFGISAFKDIRDCKNLPDFDILCAGFPCQPFSKSGYQEGFKDETRGTLFHEIMRIVKESNPNILFLENVPNLKSHDGGNTYRVIQESIEEEGYRFWSEILSPHEFGTPQIRKRLFMVAIRNDLCQDKDFEFPVGKNTETNVRSILDKKKDVSKKYYLSQEEIKILETWNYFIRNIDANVIPASPTWSQEYGRKYPLDEIHPITKPWYATVSRLKEIVVSEGLDISKWKHRRKYAKEYFPPYIISAKKPLPDWKKKFIQNNRDTWEEISDDIGEDWLNTIRSYKHTYQKFEWQVGDEKRDIWKHMIQFRPSGIRVKKSNYIPALVAIAQIPIIGWQKRRMTPLECARAQDFVGDGLMGDHFKLHPTDSVAYKQLGNAVNVKLTRTIMQEIQNYIR